MKFAEYVDRRMEEGILKGIDAGISGLGAGVKQAGKGVLNSFGGLARSGSSFVSGDLGGTARGVGQTFKGLGQLASSPLATAWRANDVYNGPFSMQLPHGGGFKQWLGIAKERPLSQSVFDSPKEEPEEPVVHGQMPPQVDFTKNRSNPQMKRTKPVQDKPVQDKPEIPDVVRLRFRPITSTLNKISMKRKVGTMPMNSEKLLKTLQSYSTRSSQNEMSWKDFEELCKSFKIDPVKLYRHIA